MDSKDHIEELLGELIEKVNILISISAIQVGIDKTTKERARLLKLAGLDNRTIAKLLNTSSGTVRVMTVKLHARR